MAADRPRPPADLLTGAALFLDFDGTLVELAESPDAVAVDARLRALLHRLSRLLDGRIAIISGRPVDGVHALIGDASLAVAGSHGLEIRWPDGRIDVPERPEGFSRIVTQMQHFANSRPGVIVEEKPFGAALHYRNRPEAMAESHALAAAIAEGDGHYLQHGKMMVEVRLGGADKGSALKTLMEAPEMAGARPVFIGDDVTDEPAMAAAAALGGAGVLVGDARDTAAIYRLPDVAAALAWLDAACPA
ncbi:trehalose-phosphatase [Sphingomonas gilva]|uniref:Trehalose 6-phosphate phosphatase n=1 Tax=Sphingomonas gilva TaxID=2305907 RepID=A0A396RX74_9SPHN|nr:trehalose-phosphatase [Sphingomonas gilva]RHW19073.1 trehalose-phosphatase [Sphingomonas gilva]